MSHPADVHGRRKWPQAPFIGLAFAVIVLYFWGYDPGVGSWVQSAQLIVHDPPTASKPKDSTPQHNFLILSSVSGGIQWEMPNCDEPRSRAAGIISAVEWMQNVSYIIIAEDCEPVKISDRVHQIRASLPVLPSGERNDAFWLSGGRFLGFRFLEFYEYLLQNPQYDYVILTDAWDVTFVSDPFTAMLQVSQYDLFIQREWRRNVQSIYMRQRYEACLTPDMYESWWHEPIYNCGLWGGKREAVLLLLQHMRDLYFGVLSAKKGTNIECFSLGVDMVVFNHAIYHLFTPQQYARLKPNEPLCPVYRNCVFVYHIANQSRHVDVHHPSCVEPHTTMVDDKLDPNGAEDFVRGVCQGSQPHVQCERLPFAAVHKGSVQWD